MVKIDKLSAQHFFGTALIRWILALIFLMQGFGKVFKFGIENVYKLFFQKQYSELLPDFILRFTVYYTSYIELIAGVFLLIGWKIQLSLYALSSVLLIITFGHGLTDPIWDLSHMMYRLALIVCLLFIPKEWDKYSIDYLLKAKT